MLRFTVQLRPRRGLARRPVGVHGERRARAGLLGVAERRRRVGLAHRCVHAPRTCCRNCALTTSMTLLGAWVAVCRRIAAAPGRHDAGDQRDGLLLQRDLRRGLGPHDDAVSLSVRGSLGTWSPRVSGVLLGSL